MAVLVSTASFGGAAAPPEVVRFISEAIIGGSPFANSITRHPTRGTAVFPTVTSVTGQTWVAEGADLPDLDVGTGAEIVAASKIGGIVQLTTESIEDVEFNLQSEVARIVQDAFSASLDDGLLNGDGTPPNPAGIIGRAADAAGTNIPDRISTAIGAMGGAGGSPDTIALGPTPWAAEAFRLDLQERPLYDGFNLTELAGSTVLVVPAAGATGLIYDSKGLFLVVGRDWDVRFSDQYAPAFKADKIAMRVTGRFGIAAPSLGRSVRKFVTT